MVEEVDEFELEYLEQHKQCSSFASVDLPEMISASKDLEIVNEVKSLPVQEDKTSQLKMEEMELGNGFLKAEDLPEQSSLPEDEPKNSSFHDNTSKSICVDSKAKLENPGQSVLATSEAKKWKKKRNFSNFKKMQSTGNTTTNSTFNRARPLSFPPLIKPRIFPQIPLPNSVKSLLFPPNKLIRAGFHAQPFQNLPTSNLKFPQVSNVRRNGIRYTRPFLPQLQQKASMYNAILRPPPAENMHRINKPKAEFVPAFQKRKDSPPKLDFNQNSKMHSFHYVKVSNLPIHDGVEDCTILVESLNNSSEVIAKSHQESVVYIRSKSFAEAMEFINKFNHTNVRSRKISCAYLHLQDIPPKILTL